MKILIKVAIVAFLAMGGGAFYGWKQFEPKAIKLREKDQEKYNLMIAEAKSFGFGEAQKLYDELKAMTPRDVVDVRYRKWKEKQETDKEFSKAYLEEEHKTRKKLKSERKSTHEKKIKNLIYDLGEAELRANNWNNSKPQQKVMALREKCAKYLKIEETDRRRRKNLLELSRVSSILDRPNKMSCGKKTADICLAVSLAEYCMDLVPNSDNDKTVLEAIQRLKGKMNYFYFRKMLKEIGAPIKDLEFQQKLKGVS
ncbi:uncharacterized protein METZ01_LOCUS379030, partial [marine metagenome]